MSHPWLAGLVCLWLLTAGCAPSPSIETATSTRAANGDPHGPAGGWPRLAPPAGLDLDRSLQAAFLVVDGVYNSELMGPWDVLHHTRFHSRPRPGIEVFTVSPDGGPVRTFEGLRLVPDHSFESAPAADILVVPSAEHSMDGDLENEPLIAWVRETGSRASFIVSLCDGAFVLAEAGLLDGRAATTFPSDQDRFAERFAAVDLRRGVSFVHHRATGLDQGTGRGPSTDPDGADSTRGPDGADSTEGPDEALSTRGLYEALTSEGGAKSYEVAMYLVDRLYGERVARGVGGGLLIPWPPADPGALAAIVAGGS